MLSIFKAGRLSADIWQMRYTQHISNLMVLLAGEGFACYLEISEMVGREQSLEVLLWVA